MALSEIWINISVNWLHCTIEKYFCLFLGDVYFNFSSFLVPHYFDLASHNGGLVRRRKEYKAQTAASHNVKIEVHYVHSFVEIAD